MYGGLLYANVVDDPVVVLKYTFGWLDAIYAGAVTGVNPDAVAIDIVTTDHGVGCTVGV
jgi:hypothetical protein